MLCSAITTTVEVVSSGQRPIAFTAGLKDLDINVLRNEVTDVAGLQIAGLDEFLFKRCMIGSTLEQLDPKHPMITLCHNP